MCHRQIPKMHTPTAPITKPFVQLLAMFPAYVDWDWFSPDARTAIGSAAEVAGQHGHIAINPEHLFYAILTNNSRVALIFRERLKDATDELVLQVTRSRKFASTARIELKLNEVFCLKLSNDTKRILRRAHKCATSFKTIHASTEHIMISILMDRQSDIESLLTKLNANPNELAVIIERTLHSNKSPRAANEF